MTQYRYTCIFSSPAIRQDEMLWFQGLFNAVVAKTLKAVNARPEYDGGVVEARPAAVALVSNRIAVTFQSLSPEALESCVESCHKAFGIQAGNPVEMKVFRGTSVDDSSPEDSSGEAGAESKFDLPQGWDPGQN